MVSAEDIRDAAALLATANEYKEREPIQQLNRGIGGLLARSVEDEQLHIIEDTVGRNKIYYGLSKREYAPTGKAAFMAIDNGSGFVHTHQGEPERVAQQVYTETETIAAIHLERGDEPNFRYSPGVGENVEFDDFPALDGQVEITVVEQ